MKNIYFEDLVKTIKEHNLDLSFLASKIVLFTGAAGLLGRYFVDLICQYNKMHDQKIDVIALDLSLKSLQSAFKESKNDVHLYLVEGDITKPIEVLDSFQIDYIIHAASPANPYFFANNPVETLDANYNGTKMMLELAKRKSSKFIFVSSGEVYGSTSCPSTGYRESDLGLVDCAKSRSCYTEGKRVGETLTVSYAKEYGVQGLIARLCYVYGPTYSDKETRVIFQFLNDAINGRDILMQSSGEQKRSYLYVGDCVSGLFKLMQSGQISEVYNLVGDSVVSIKEIAMTICLLNPSHEVIFQEATELQKQGFSPFASAIQDGEKLKGLGFVDKNTIKEGLFRTLEVKRYLKEVKE